jgi:hypothetical protein
MAELLMFPPGGDQSPAAKIARLEAHVFHLSRHIKELEDEHSELKKDREALIRAVLWRIIIFGSMVIGALASSDSTSVSPTELLKGLTGSLG